MWLKSEGRAVEIRTREVRIEFLPERTEQRRVGDSFSSIRELTLMARQPLTVTGPRLAPKVLYYTG